MSRVKHETTEVLIIRKGVVLIAREARKQDDYAKPLSNSTKYPVNYVLFFFLLLVLVPLLGEQSFVKLEN